jgi:hypothetical protein
MHNSKPDVCWDERNGQEKARKRMKSEKRIGVQRKDTIE